MTSVFFVNDRYIWLIDSRPGVDCLIKINCDLGEPSCEYIFRDSIFGKELFSDMVLVNDKVVFIPREAEKIYIWSFGERKLQSIELKSSYVKQFESSYSKFTNAVVISDCVYFIPHKYSALVKVDTRNLGVEYIDCFDRDVLSIHEGNGGFFEKGINFDNVIYMLCNGSNAICMYDVNEKTFKIIRIGDEYIRFSDLYFDGNDYWLTDKKDRVLKGNIVNGELKCVFDYAQTDIKKSHDNSVYNRIMIPFHDDIWLFSYNYPIIKINTKDYKYTNIQYKEEKKDPIKGFNYVNAIKYKDQVYALNYNAKTVDVFDLKSGDKTNSYSYSVGENEVLKSFIDMVTNL